MIDLDFLKSIFFYLKQFPVLENKWPSTVFLFNASILFLLSYWSSCDKIEEMGNAILANFGTRGGGTLWCNSCSCRQWCCRLFPEVWFLWRHCSQQPVEVNRLKYCDYTNRKKLFALLSSRCWQLFFKERNFLPFISVN